MFPLHTDSIEAFCSTCSPESKVSHSKTTISVGFTSQMAMAAVSGVKEIPEPKKPSVEIKPTKGNLIVPATK